MYPAGEQSRPVRPERQRPPFQPNIQARRKAVPPTSTEYLELHEEPRATNKEKSYSTSDARLPKRHASSRHPPISLDNLTPRARRVRSQSREPPVQEHPSRSYRWSSEEPRFTNTFSRRNSTARNESRQWYESSAQTSDAASTRRQSRDSSRTKRPSRADVPDARKRHLSYQPLNHQKDEIRLMRVDLSGSGHYEYELKSNISLRMSKPRYTALSYPWGDKHRRKHIEVDGCVLSISRNLYYALKAVKESWKSVGIMEEERYVWIDQVCIDQKHDAEKNHQVAFMGNIYEMAEQVVIWLPVPMRIRSNFNTWQTWRDWHLRHSSQHQWLHDFGTLTRSMKDAKAAHRGIAPGQEKSLLAWRNANCIVESPWWNRAWVYQEFMLSTRAIFLLDGMTIPWLDLHQFLGDFYSRLPLHAADCEEAITELGLQESRLQAVGSEKTSVWKRLSRRGRLVLGILRTDEHEARSSLFDVRRQMRELDTYNQERAKAEMAWKLASFVMRSRANRSDSLGRSFQPLSTLMDHGRNCNSADPRDKVFAFLGLADPRYNIVADYRESRTSNALLTEVAARIIIIEQRLDILAIAMDDRNNIYHGDDVLPTWVPNWSRAHNPNSEYKRFLRQIGFPLANDCNPRPCRASMDVQPQVAILPDRYGNPGRVLCARAIFVATLGKMVKDDHAQPWRLFKSKDTELRITASHLARPGDEVFVILGADEPFVLSRHPGTQFCYLRGHAMLWEQGIPSPILQGYMIGELQRRKVSVETVYIS